jgi:hypothetical protein
MGYVVNLLGAFFATPSVCTRGRAFFEAIFKKLLQFSSASQAAVRLHVSACNRFAQQLPSNAGMRKGMGRLLVALLVLPASYLSLSASSPNQPLHYQLASDPNLHGKGKDGECMDYALALSSRLAQHGIHGRLIFYRWHVRGTEAEGSHVFVFYHLPDNSEWIVDNEIAHPRKVPADASLMQLVFLLSDTKAAPVDVELQNGLNHLSFF